MLLLGASHIRIGKDTHTRKRTHIHIHNYRLYSGAKMLPGMLKDLFRKCASLPHLTIVLTMKAQAQAVDAVPVDQDLVYHGTRPCESGCRWQVVRQTNSEGDERC